MNADTHIKSMTCVMATGVPVLSHSRLQCLHTISFNNFSFNFLYEFPYFTIMVKRSVRTHYYRGGGIILVMVLSEGSVEG